MEKVFVITISDVDDYNEIHHPPIVFKNIEDAKEHLCELYDDADNQIGVDWEREKGDLSFSIYLMGEYSCNHYCAVIDEVILR